MQPWMLIVAAEHRGTGVADLLVQETLGDVPAYLWVLTGNARAQAFYRRLGFVDIPPYRFNPFDDAVYLALEL